MGNPITVHRLKELLKDHAPDIIFLMETKNTEEVITNLLPFFDYESRFLVPPHSPGGGGLAIYWKKDIDLHVLCSCNNYIDTSISYKNNIFVATFVYGEPDHTKRRDVWNEIINLAFSREEPWFLTGDFNDILENCEKTGGPTRTEGSFGDFRAFISQGDLYDIQHSGNSLSWRGVRYTHLIHSR